MFCEIFYLYFNIGGKFGKVYDKDEGMYLNI